MNVLTCRLCGRAFELTYHTHTQGDTTFVKTLIEPMGNYEAWGKDNWNCPECGRLKTREDIDWELGWI